MEVHPALEKRTKITIIALIIILIVVASPAIYLVEHGANGITAIEGKEIADDMAREWNRNATLYLIDRGSIMTGDGHFQIWGYYYMDDTNITNTTECIGITVESNGETSFIHNTSMEDTEPIGDFSLDSDDAYAIARDIPALASFLERNPSVEIFSLESSSSNPVWTIELVESSIAGQAKWARVRIDANTGDVLYVNVDA